MFDISWKTIFGAKPAPNLFQYWDTGTPPDEVAVRMDAWSKVRGIRYRRFDRAEAHDYIAGHFGADVATAFAACRVPAMQADVFRVCALLAEGGLYVDADLGSRGSVKFLKQAGPRGLLYVRHNRVGNDLVFVRDAQDPLPAALMDIIVANIASRREGNVWQLSGPGILTQLWRQSGEGSLLFKGYRFEELAVVREWVHFPGHMSYKDGPKHWLNVKDNALYFDRDL